MHIEVVENRDMKLIEQNPLARKIYEYMGFEVYDRSDIDEQGLLFPLLFMRLNV